MAFRKFKTSKNFLNIFRNNKINYHGQVRNCSSIYIMWLRKWCNQLWPFCNNFYLVKWEASIWSHDQVSANKTTFMFCWRWRNPSSKLVKVTMEVKTLLIWLIDISRQIKIHQQSLFCSPNLIFYPYFLSLPLDFMNISQQKNDFFIDLFWFNLI